MKILNGFKKVISAALALLLLSAYVPAKITLAAETNIYSPKDTQSPNDWTSPSGAYAAGGGVTSNSANNEKQGYDEFNIPALPAGSQITGVEVLADAYSDDRGSDCQLGIELSWDNGSHWTSKKSLFLDEAMSTKKFGGSIDTWGRAWGINDFSNPNFSLQVQALDPATNSDCSIQDKIYLDWLRVKVHFNQNTAPTSPALVGPENMTVTNDNTPVLTWNDSVDPDGDTINYAVSLAGPNAFNESFLVGGAVRSYVHPGLPVDGIYIWKVRAVDVYGNFSEWSSEWSFTLDRVNPVVSELTATPSPFSPGNVDGVKDQANVSYEISENSKVKIVIYNEEDALVRNLLDGKDQLVGKNDVVWDGKDDALALVADGTYKVMVKAEDLSGNISAEVMTSVVVDNEKPVLEEMKDIRTNTSIELAGAATDNQTSFTGDYKWEQISGPENGTVTFVAENNPTTLAAADLDGDYTLKLTATDAAGNQSSAVVKFTWDTKVSPIDNLYAVTGVGFVDLHWENPVDEDLKEVLIYRSLQKEELGTLVAELKDDETVYEDNSVVGGLTYYYSIVTVDTVGNKAVREMHVTPEVISTVPAVVAPVAENPTLASVAPHKVSASQAPKEEAKEVKSETKENNNDDGKVMEEKSDVPLFGIIVLLLLAIFGLYLLYQQYPNFPKKFAFFKKPNKK